VDSRIERDLEQAAKLFPDGLTSQEIVSFFRARGIALSESVFRKYVQLGLLPRSRRIGSKGKHRGSKGIYPVRILERIYGIRRLMEDGYTIEEIQKGVMRFRGRLDDVERSISDLFGEFEQEIRNPRFDAGFRKTVEGELAAARETASVLMQRLEGVEKLLTESEPRAASEEAEKLVQSADRRFF